MLKKLTPLLLCSFLLVSCQGVPLGGAYSSPSVVEPAVKEGASLSKVSEVIVAPLVPISQKYDGLKSWWSFFGDSVLNSFVSSALSMNATSLGKKHLFPQGNNITKETLQEYYKDPHVALVTDIVKDYLDYRYVQNQRKLLKDYIAEQEFFLKGSFGANEDALRQKIKTLHTEDSKLEAHLAEVIGSLAKTTKLLPEYVEEVLKQIKPIHKYDITPIMASSALMLAFSPDIKVARTFLAYKTQGKITEKQSGSVFSDIPFNQFLGVSNELFVNPQISWKVVIGSAKSKVDFGVINKYFGYDRDKQVFKENVLSYVTDIERLFVTISALQDQQKVLEKAIERAAEGDVYKSRLASLRAEYELAKSVVDLFNRLGIY